MPDPKKTIASPAGLGRRLAALLYDLLLMLAVWMATLFALVAANSFEPISGFWLQLVLLAELAAYYLYSWLKTGQTLGMRSWRLQMVDEDGNKPDLQACLIRIAVAPFSYAFAGLGMLWLYAGHRQQTWQDMASKTFVVLLPKT